ncbi:MAG: hypothetical protein Q9209_003643 [Squamulea sp. 1 TL-2023]
MDLPVEVRVIIYDLALVRSKIFVPTVSPKKLHDGKDDPNLFHISWGVNHPPYRLLAANGDIYDRYLEFEDYTQERPPVYLGLLQGVSKAVQVEAEAVFYSPKNQFVMPAGLFWYPAVHGMEWLETNNPRIPPFQNISFTFDMRDSSADSLADSYAFRKKMNQHHDRMYFDNDLTQKNRLRLIHNKQKKGLEDVWFARCLTIKKLDLRYLELDFEECYCPMGCCRMVQFICAKLWAIARLYKSLDRIDVLGLAGSGEERRVRSQLAGDDRSWSESDKDDEGGNHGPCGITCRLTKLKRYEQD